MIRHIEIPLSFQFGMIWTRIGGVNALWCGTSCGDEFEVFGSGGVHYHRNFNLGCNVARRRMHEQKLCSLGRLHDCKYVKAME